MTELLCLSPKDARLLSPPSLRIDTFSDCQAFWLLPHTSDMPCVTKEVQAGKAPLTPAEKKRRLLAQERYLASLVFQDTSGEAPPDDDANEDSGEGESQDDDESEKDGAEDSRIGGRDRRTRNTRGGNGKLDGEHTHKKRLKLVMGRVGSSRETAIHQLEELEGVVHEGAQARLSQTFQRHRVNVRHD